MDHAHLQSSIDLCGGGQRWGGIDFDKPGFEGLVDEHIEAIDFEAVLVVDDHGLHRFQRNVDDVSDAFEALVNEFFAAGHFKEEFQILDRPLAAMHLIVIFGTLLHGDVRKMDHHVIKLCDIRRVLLRAKTGKTTRIPTN